MTRFTLSLLIAMLLMANSALAQDDPPLLPLAGDEIILAGTITDTEGEPLEGAVVEIWQTDAAGRYDHPQDNSPTPILDTFQYFGRALSDEDGAYSFLTIFPGEYEPRPAHIHYKVFVDDELVLISQFYFVREPDERSLFVKFAPPAALGEDDEARDVPVLVGDIVVDINGNAPDEIEPNIVQAEGPFYPVVDFSDYDNNLVNPAPDEEPFRLPVPEQDAPDE